MFEKCELPEFVEPLRQIQLSFNEVAGSCGSGERYSERSFACLACFGACLGAVLSSTELASIGLAHCCPFKRTRVRLAHRGYYVHFCSKDDSEEKFQCSRGKTAFP